MREEERIKYIGKSLMPIGLGFLKQIKKDNLIVLILERKINNIMERGK